MCSTWCSIFPFQIFLVFILLIYFNGINVTEFTKLPCEQKELADYVSPI